MELTTELKKTALHDVHETLGAKMVPFAGFRMPVRYTSDLEEHTTVRRGVGVFDVSHMGEFIVQGKGALELLQLITTNDVSKLYPGKVQYSCMTNERGGIVDDLLVYMLGEDKYMLVVNASGIEKDKHWILAHNTFDARLSDVSDDYALFAVQGPAAAEALQSLTSVDLSGMEYYTFEKNVFAGVDDIIISATGYTGSGGFELYIPNNRAQEVWTKIFEAGHPYGIKPIGLGARDTLRLEAGFCLYGNDIDDTTSPVEAGLGWITKFSKNFIASDILRKQKEEGLSRKLIGFEMIDRGIPRQGYSIVDANGETIGQVTSGTQSPMLGIGIGMGYVKTAYAEPGTELFVVVRDKVLKATVIKMPFYKP